MSLFACTHCNARHPFEQLSKGDQLCKDCRKTYPLVTCTYCRLEFHLLRNTEKDPVCKKCTYNFKMYGQPSCCEYCNIRAAFEGSKCSRCLSSEKKYGPPVSCEQCKLNCAFEKPAEARDKVDGKTLCLLCTLSYKRILHKAKKREKRVGGQDAHKRERKSKHAKLMKTENNDSPKDGKPLSVAAAALERIGNNRGSPLNIGIYSSMTNDANSESIMLESHITELTELKEQVVNFKKQVQQKEQALIEKEKKITELKAEHWEKEKEFRQKIIQMQKDNADRVESLQVENRNLKRQVSSLSKAEKVKPDKPVATSG
ncbi:PREDICTED: protein FAM76A-like [Acropora digitifera]|uniref:protein FAM76A-like n=1 Tax=Acropora digitifera TaxID=70779 RepID=UPI00077A9375|nr:PREDICTED: protein FAM76A-like [Acropora digitifera]